MDDPLRTYLAREIRRTSANAVAARLGVERRTLANYLIGVSRIYLSAQIEAKCAALNWPPAEDEGES